MESSWQAKPLQNGEVSPTCVQESDSVEKYINYKKLKKILSVCDSHLSQQVSKGESCKKKEDGNFSEEDKSDHVSVIVDDKRSSSEDFIPFNPRFPENFDAANAFFSCLKAEVHKVKEFYHQNITEAENKASQIALNVQAAQNKDLSSNLPLIGTSPKSMIRKAIKESYRHLELLKRYLLLNQIAVYKALKKFDKVFSSASPNSLQRTGYDSTSYLEKLNQSFFYGAIAAIKPLMTNMENLMMEFESVPRKRAMNKLRVPSQRSHTITYYAFGLLFGLSVSPLFSSMFLFRSFTDTYAEGFLMFPFILTMIGLTILRIYAGISIPILMTFFFSIIVFLWDKYRVNYAFILGLDLRKHLKPSQFGLMGAFLLLLFSYTCAGHIYYQAFPPFWL